MSKFLERIYYPDFLTVYNPFFLKDMSKALERTVKAINEREKIVIYGACNVDSICGISLLLLVLKYLNADVEYYIPDEIEETSLINNDVIKNHIKFLGAGLVITVGCGMESSAQVDYCKTLGIDVIIIDTENYTDNLNTIVINPNQKECLYKFKSLSYSGLAFKLTQAISMYYDMKCISKYIDLVMLGTLSAKVPLIEENDILVNEGLRHLHCTNNYGIKALLKLGKIRNVDIEAVNQLVFIVTPTMNAIGKMDNARIAVELLTTGDGYRAEQIAKYLNKEVMNNFAYNIAYR